MWSDWNAIEAAQQAADEQNAERHRARAERRARTDTAPGPSGLSEAALQALSVQPYVPDDVAKRTAIQHPGATLSRWDERLRTHVIEPIPERPPLDDAGGIRLWINDLRDMARRLRR